MINRPQHVLDIAQARRRPRDTTQMLRAASGSTTAATTASCWTTSWCTAHSAGGIFMLVPAQRKRGTAPAPPPVSGDMRLKSCPWVAIGGGVHWNGCSAAELGAEAGAADCVAAARPAAPAGTGASLHWQQHSTDRHQLITLLRHITADATWCCQGSELESCGASGDGEAAGAARRGRRAPVPNHAAGTGAGAWHRCLRVQASLQACLLHLTSRTTGPVCCRCALLCMALMLTACACRRHPWLH